MSTATALAPVTILPNSRYAETERGNRFAHWAKPDFFGNTFAMVKDIAIGDHNSRKVEAFTRWDIAGKKAYHIRVTRTFGLGFDKVGYVFEGVGETPAQARRNLDELYSEMQCYSIPATCRMELDFNAFVWPLDADFSTLSTFDSSMPDGFIHNYILKSPACDEMAI